MPLSDVAAIVNRQGRWRVVVADASTFKHHVSSGERIIIVPDLKVQEPVPHEEIAPLIEKVQKYVVQTLTPANHCGECRACCIAPHIKEDEFDKPAGIPCRNLCEIGCKIYQYRPQVCRRFNCLWLVSQSRNDRMASKLRPDRCGAFFAADTETNDPLIFEVHGNPNRHAMRWIEEMQRLGYKAKKITHYVGGDR